MEHLVRPITVPSQNRRHESPEVEQLEVGGALERLIAQELGNEPYQLELNAASFSYMTKEELHEVQFMLIIAPIILIIFVPCLLAFGQDLGDCESGKDGEHLCR